MNCCSSAQCQGIESVFDDKRARESLQRYRREGPAKTTRLLIEAIKEAGLTGATLLDIGGGVGAIQHELLNSGVTTAVAVDASSAYLRVAQQEAEAQGHAGRETFLFGNFVELAPEIQPADIVTLDRVICCYDDMPALVRLSAGRAQKLYGVVFPRETWWARAGIGLFDFVQKLLRQPFRIYLHPSPAIERIVHGLGFQRAFYHKGLFWQVILYAK